MSANIKAVKSGTLHERALAFRPEVLETFERTKNWLDQSVTWVTPFKNGMLHVKVVDSWESISWPMNTQRSFRLKTIGMEVGEAYNFLFGCATKREMADEHYGKQNADIIHACKFVLTTEEDNIIPPEAVEWLCASIYTCPDCGKEITDLVEWTCASGHRGYDVVSGLYFTKSIPPRPMAYGDPTKGDDFRPVSVKDAVERGKTIEVNGIGMGCAIWRKELFAKVSEPWFVTDDATQDLYFCKKAKAEAGARFGVNCAVKVGHMDFKTGRIF